MIKYIYINKKVLNTLNKRVNMSKNNYIVDVGTVETLELIYDALKTLQVKIPSLENFNKVLSNEEKYKLQQAMIDKQDGFKIFKEYRINSSKFKEYKEFNILLKEIDDVKNINEVYSGALKSNELHQDMINELKNMMNDLDMGNEISKKMMNNIENTFIKRFETIEQVSYALEETIKKVVNEINDLEKSNEIYFER